MRTGYAFAPGTWGELVQGVDSRGRHLLVGLPSRSGCRAEATLSPRRRGAPPVRVGPRWSRTRAVVALLLSELGQRDLQVTLRLESALPRGAGRASSSADLLAALAATCRALGRRVSGAALCALAARVEPTNPTLLPGWALYRQRRGEWLGSAAPVPLRLLPLPGVGSVDTLSWHRQAPPWTRSQRRESARALAALEDGLAARDPRLVAAAATRSALLAAERRTRPDLLTALERARSLGALGLAISHSGTGAVAIFPPGAAP